MKKVYKDVNMNGGDQMGSKRYDGAHKSIENVEAKTKSADEKEAEFKPKDLMKDVRDWLDKRLEITKDVLKEH